MAVYDINGNELLTVYGRYGATLTQAYDVYGNPLLSGGGGDEWVKTILPYDTNYIINTAWLTSANTQRDALIALYNQTDDGIPFFIQSDGHGRKNEGNKGCHNLAEETMQYVRNIMLGDYASYYSDGNNPRGHKQTSDGIQNYIPVMGNHEFLNNNSAEALLADLPTLVDSYTPKGAVLGSQTYGYYKVTDDKYNVKYLIGQPYIPDEQNSSGFIAKYLSDQWEWFIAELSANDGYDIVVLNHQPYAGTYTRREAQTTKDYTGGSYNLTPILEARKAKTSGTYTDADNNVHSYDFSGCQTDLLCVLHGHTHVEMYIEKTAHGYPVYIADVHDNDYKCCYGLIDRENGKVHFLKFGRSGAWADLVLDL